MKRILPLLAFLLTSCQKQSIKSVRIKITNQDCRSLKKSVNVDNCAPSVTVFVHGTILTPSWIMHDFFYSIPGIQHYSLYDKKYRLYVIADRACSTSDSCFDAQHFYHFGWSGKLSFQERERAAHHLAHELQRLLHDYVQKYNKKPHITIITHSHGGNVVLSMAQCDVDIEIDRLILLACPVQKKTVPFVQHSMFKHVYSFYSSLDAIQVLDPQGIQTADKGKIFSERLFPASKNLVQINIKMNGRGLLHIEFLLEKFLLKLSAFLYKLEELDADTQLVYLSYWDKSSLMK